MPIPIIATKLYVPPPRARVVVRTRLNDRLNEVLSRKLTLISAPAGFGKTTLVSEWCAAHAGRSLPKTRSAQSKTCSAAPEVPIAWLSLDEADNDPTRFLTYLIVALQTIVPDFGQSVFAALQTPQPPPVETSLTGLLNEISALLHHFVLVLDDYHVIDAKPVDDALDFLLEHLPPQMHLVITTREDPNLPLAHLRVRDQLTELRSADLRFTAVEAAGFLNQVMGLELSAQNITALEIRTEGWIAGLQLAAISMQGLQDTTGFIKSFTGSHHFVMDYLVEQVLLQQPPGIQAFLLRTAILDRLCGPLCDGVLLTPVGSGQETLEYLERANLFLVPLDNERRWYRYHHLFADLLRQRLQQPQPIQSSPKEGMDAEELHGRASVWYQANGLELEAFHHAAAAHDIERAEYLIEGEGMPLQFRGAGVPVLHWLESLPKATLDARPSLWVTYASTLLFNGQHTSVEHKLESAEAALQAIAQDVRTRDLIGRIASMRATLGVIRHDVDAIITQSRRALEYLAPDNLPVRTATTWTLGYAYQVRQDRTAAAQAYSEVIATGKKFGDSIYVIAANINLGQLQEADNQLFLAAETYRHALQLAGDPPQLLACEACLGLARIAYQWNDLDTADKYGQQCFEMLEQMERVDTVISYRLFLARLKLARQDADGAAEILAQAKALVLDLDYVHLMPAVAETQVLTLLAQGNLSAAARLAQTEKLTHGRARVLLAQRDPGAALAILKPLREQAETSGWADEQLKVMVLQALAHHAHREKDKAVELLTEALDLAEPGGLIRLFVDEGMPLTALLRDAAKQGNASAFVRRVQAAFGKAAGSKPMTDALIEPLSERERQVLALLGTELTGPEIARELMVSLNTLRTHTKNIYTKLAVNDRRAAVRRARELDLF